MIIENDDDTDDGNGAFTSLHRLLWSAAQCACLPSGPEDFYCIRQNVMLLENGDATADRPLKGKGTFNSGTLWRQTNMKQQDIRTIQQYFGIGKKIINSGEMQHGSKQGEGGFWGSTLEFIGQDLERGRRKSREMN